MSEQTIESRITSVIVDQFGLAPADVTPASKLTEDLGADSLDEVDLVMALEEEFDIKINDETAADFKTVQHVIDHVTKVTEG